MFGFRVARVGRARREERKNKRRSQSLSIRSLWVGLDWVDLR